MNYVIDTYNLIHAADMMGGPLSGMTVRRLCQYLVASAAVKATLVLDGRAKPDEPSENEFPDVTLVYSGAGVSADTVIGQMIERKGKGRKKWTVVTNDRAVALHALRNYANAMSCEAFLRQITQNPARGQEHPGEKMTGSATSGESAHWMEQFGFKGEGDARKKIRPKFTEEGLGGLNVEDLLGPRG